MNSVLPDFLALRAAMAEFDPSPNIKPNETITVDKAFFPEGHRGVLDLRRQLVVGNRGMGKSFWTHALTNPTVRNQVAEEYSQKILKNADVYIGFNGSEKVTPTAPTVDEISALLAKGCDPILIWRAVFLRIVQVQRRSSSLDSLINDLICDPTLYSSALSSADDVLLQQNKTLLIVFDALDRLGRNWNEIRLLTKALLELAVGLQSFRAIRVKIFMRVDQFADQNLFRFTDSSKIRNDHVSLIWRPNELYGLLLFELLRNPVSQTSLTTIAKNEGLSIGSGRGWSQVAEQEAFIRVLAGEFMGSNKKRGRVYTWVPLHLSDAADTCSPRSFLTAWKKAAEHTPVPVGRAVDHLGLSDGVRSASSSRLEELYEDYPWIEPALGALRRQLVPMEREKLFELWEAGKVIQDIKKNNPNDTMSMPIKFMDGDELPALLSAMRDVGVMEDRSNGKVNVPDIFRVKAEILRKGGVAVPRRKN